MCLSLTVEELDRSLPWQNWRISYSQWTSKVIDNWPLFYKQSIYHCAADEGNDQITFSRIGHHQQSRTWAVLKEEKGNKTEKTSFHLDWNEFTVLRKWWSLHHEQKNIMKYNKEILFFISTSFVKGFKLTKDRCKRSAGQIVKSKLKIYIFYFIDSK